ncbi:MAG: alpha/beta fold hydrolase [Planctomycetia bacterium]|nr:alpha/beta fold hydrolase [Planctomycetia bacterium]
MPSAITDEPIGSWRSHCRSAPLRAAAIFCVVVVSGCQGLSSRRAEIVAPPPTNGAVAHRTTLGAGHDGAHSSLVSLRVQRAPAPAGPGEAAAAYAWAGDLQEAGRPECVDIYYGAAVLAWRSLEAELEAGASLPGQPSSAVIYRASIERLIAAAQQHRRIVSRRELLIYTAGGPARVPVSYHGFAWQPEDFDFLVPATLSRRHEVSPHYFTPGLGASLVAVRVARPNDLFFRPRHPFAVSALLRPAPDRAGPADAADFVLEFYNPHVFDRTSIGGIDFAIERDLTAPLEFVYDDSPRQFLEGYLSPGDANVKAKLLMMEPYQRGKIPVVFVHGLLSDALDWAGLTNQLRAQPDLYQQFQFWAFRYPTGGELLASVADFRDLLQLVRESSDPTHSDRALDRMVLVGHSMGGLVSKMQVAHSYDILWRQVARAPIESVRAGPIQIERLRRMLFFEPEPSITRVVFIGTPHRGSEMSQRVIGRVSADLVRFTAEEDQQYRALMDANRDVFYSYLWNSRPTSVDLLEPDSPILAALRQMPLSPKVQLHSIIGTGGPPSKEPGDGVVPVTSARHPGVTSELFVPVRHSELRQAPEVVAEMMRILREHAAGGSDESGRVAGPFTDSSLPAAHRRESGTGTETQRWSEGTCAVYARSQSHFPASPF